jgi:hypothetical protein
MLARTALALLLLTAASAQGATHNAKFPVIGNGDGPLEPVVQQNLRLISTSFSSGYLKGPVAPSFRPMDLPLALTCPKKPAGNCVYEAQMSVTLKSSEANNRVSVCATLDGRYMDDPRCIALQDANATGNTTLTHTNRASGIAPGEHRLRSFLYSDFGVDPHAYIVTYRVYKETQ